MEAYLQAKADLFQRILPKEGWCVLNADIPQFEILKEVAGPRPLLSYGYGGKDIQIQSVTPHNTGQIASLLIQGEPFEISLPLIGEFQLYNALCALGLVIACSPDYREAAIGHMNTLEPIPGRLEHIGSTPHKAAIYIDYAHTADGMETLLKSLRDHTKNHIHIVFGGGGDRDPGTRKPRGDVAQNLADAVYISDDNPRFEDPQKIRAQILEGCPKAQEIPDRREAIFKAVQSLQEGDSLVVAGKGIEEGQEVQGIVHPFSDKQTIIEALKTL
jgi:UDP-N-acetylmuramoyl-L-alanyl-D-glutamate--2,6-diaminopimelate ligase